MSAALAHVAGVPVEEGIAFLGPAVLLLASGATASARAALHRRRHRPRRP